MENPITFLHSLTIDDDCRRVQPDVSLMELPIHTPSMPLALEGMKILDCSQVLAGPFCTMLLADMGADIVKIEKPSGGDDTRHMGPPFVGGESAAFLAMNRNKRSVVLDFKHERGLEAARRLASGADVVIENYRAGTMDRLGLGYDELSEANPSLIYCSISGFGRTGPYSRLAGYDLIAQGMSGLMSITGMPGSPPVKVGVPMADLNAGMFATYGILAAYIHKLKTGQGQYLEVSLLEAALAYMVWESGIYFTTGEVSRPLGSAHRLSAPYQSLKTADGYINVGAPSDANWARLARALGRDDLLTDERFTDNAGRMANLEELEAELESTLAEHGVAHWLELLEGAGVPAGPVLDVGQVWTNEHVRSRNMDVTLEHPTAGQVHHIGHAAKLYGTPGRFDRPAPTMGQHTADVLSEAGYTQGEIEELRAVGAAGAAG